MKIFASGEGQSIEPRETRDAREIYGRVVGVTDLGNNGYNDFGWCGDKAIVHCDGRNYVLDYPEAVDIFTDDGVPIVSCHHNAIDVWMPDVKQATQYGLFVGVV